MNTIEQLLALKDGEIYSIAPSATVYEALRLMAEKEIGALLVLEGDELVGIMSERDYARKVLLKGKTSREATVEEIMTRQVISAKPSDTIEECMGIMTRKRIRHLPIQDDEGLQGIVSIGDLVKAIISEQQSTIEQLEHYIRG